MKEVVIDARVCIFFIKRPLFERKFEIRSANMLIVDIHLLILPKNRMPLCYEEFYKCSAVKGGSEVKEG